LKQVWNLLHSFCAGRGEEASDSPENLSLKTSLLNLPAFAFITGISKDIDSNRAMPRTVIHVAVR
jgi:hypothetical protein